MDNLLPYVRAVLSTSAGRWLALTESLPIELLTRPPADKEWSALECLQHLIDTERLAFTVRLQAFLAGQDFAAFDPDTQGAKPTASRRPADLAAEFARYRTASLALLAQVTPPDLSKTARHSELGLVTLGEMLHEWAAHDLMHAVQAKQALMQPFITGSGPWRPYFVKHDVAAPARA